MRVCSAATSHDLNEARVAFLVAPGFDHVAIQWGIWRAGGIAVPLPLSHPPAELEYLIRDSEASIVIADPANTRDVRAACEVCRRAVRDHATSFRTLRDLSHPSHPLSHLARRPRHDPLHERHDEPPERVSSRRTRTSPRRSNRSSTAWEWTPPIARCSSSRSITFTASSTSSAARCGAAPCWRCTRSSMRTQRGTGSRLAS